MRKALVPLALLAMASVAMGAPNYSLSWDFESDTVGQAPSGGWNQFIPSWGATNPANTYQKVYDTSLAPAASALPSPYSFGSKKLGAALNSGYSGSRNTLAQPTNSFIYKAEMYTDIRVSQNGWFNSSGLNVGLSWNGVADGTNFWMEGESSRSKNLATGFPFAVNEGSDLAWLGGNRRAWAQDGGLGLDNLLANAANTQNSPAKVEIMFKYNTPDNPGTLEIYTRHPEYDGRRAAAGVWIKTVWRNQANTVAYDHYTLPIDPGTGAYPVATSIEVHTNGWTHTYFDNITFESIPEPAALALLSVGSLPLLRRRRRA